MGITIKRAEGLVEFCTDLALRGEWEQAQAALNESRASLSDRWINGDEREAAQAVQALEQQMAESTIVFRLRAVSRKQWQETVAAHPPREDNAADEAMGTNVSSFFDALLGQSPDPAKGRESTIIAVNEKASGDVIVFDPSADWQTLADDMTDGQYSEFAQKVFELNRGVVARPTSRAASLVMRGSEQNSKQQNGSA